VHTSTKYFVMWKSSDGIFSVSLYSELSRISLSSTAQVNAAQNVHSHLKNETRKIHLSRKIVRQENISVGWLTLRLCRASDSDAPACLVALSCNDVMLSEAPGKRSDPVAESNHPYRT